MKLLQRYMRLPRKELAFYSIAIFLFWLKTYIAYKVEFNLGIQGFYQQFLLFINPLNSAIIFLGLALFFRGKKQYIFMIIINLIMTLILYANIVFYRFFNDFLTLPVLYQTKNFGDVSGSAKSLMTPYDIFYFLDIVILIALIAFKVIKPQERLPKKKITYVLGTGVLVFLINLGLAEIDRPQLLTRTFDRNYLVKYLGAYNYTIYDMVQNVHSSTQRAFADSNDVDEVLDYTTAHNAKPNNQYFGKAKDMNVIYVSLESFQNFLIGKELDGQEITPFLNSLTEDKNTFYFDNFFHQTGQGKTSDAEFLMENSLFPLPQGSVFYLKAQNTYQATPAILKSHGYTSAVFHGNYKSFWNRDVMYKSLGIDKFFDARYYDMEPDHVIGYGMEDKPFFEESMPLLSNLKQHFYSRFISLSNHFDFELDDEDITFPAADTGDGVVNRYFQTAHYTDEAIEQFFNELKASGLYDNTIVVLYGDHYGLSSNHYGALSKYLGKDITPFENIQLQKVPLFIHVPNVQSPGEPIHTYGGEIDVRPTVLHLLGIDTKPFVQFGTDLLSSEHDSTVAFRDGDVVTPNYTYTKGKCYSNGNGLEIDKETCKPYSEAAKRKLSLSDKVVYEDLLRFYQPTGTEPLDKSKISYLREDQDQGLPDYVLPHYNQKEQVPQNGQNTEE